MNAYCNAPLKEYAPYTIRPDRMILVLLLEDILQKACDVMHITFDQAKSKCREREIVKTRRIYYYNATKYTTYSFKVIGSLVNVDHSTVSSALRNAEIDIKVYNQSDLYEIF